MIDITSPEFTTLPHTAMDDPPPGYVLRITPERFGGVGPWAA